MEIQREDSVELVEKILYQTAAVECSVCGKLYDRKTVGEYRIQGRDGL